MNKRRGQSTLTQDIKVHLDQADPYITLIHDKDVGDLSVIE